MKDTLFLVAVIASVGIAVGLISFGLRTTRKTAPIWGRLRAAGLLLAGLLLLVALGLAWFNTTTFERGVHAVAFSPDGRWLASGSVDQTIKIWDVANTLWGVTFSPDGRWLASAGDGSHLKLWEIATGRELRTLTPHTGRVFDVAFSPDGRWLASAGWDNAVRLWEVASGRKLNTLAPGKAS